MRLSCQTSVPALAYLGIWLALQPLASSSPPTSSMVFSVSSADAEVPPHELVITVGPESLTAESAAEIRAVDFSTRTVTTTDLRSKTIKPESLFALVDRHHLMSENQALLAATSQWANAGKSDDPSSAEVTPALVPPDIGEGIVKDSTDGESLLEYAASGEPSSPQALRGLTMFLRHHYGVDEAALTELSKLNYTPETLTIMPLHREGGVTKLVAQPTRTLPHPSLEGVRPFLYPAPLSAPPTPSALPLLAESLSASKDLFARGEYLDAFCLLLAYSMANGSPSPELKEKEAKIVDHPSVTELIRALAPADSAEAQESLRTLSRLENSSTHAAPIIKAFRANIMSAIGEYESARTLLREVLEAYPQLVSAWFDLGATYQAEMDTSPAWLCYEIAQGLNPDHPASREIASVKQALLDDYPSFFSLEE